MAVGFTLKYHDKVVIDDLPRISLINRKRIQAAIEQKLLAQPEVFGIPLRKSLRGYRKLRVGDYRVIFRIENKMIIKIFVIQHRSIVYQRAENRLRLICS